MIVWAILEGWSLKVIMCVYWFQSVIIGVFWGVRIFQLKEFSTQEFYVNDQPVKPTASTKIKTGIFFLFHYNFFHVIYALFLVQVLGVGMILKTQLISVVLPAAGVFLLDQVFSFWYNRKEDERKKPNLGKITSYPYMRIIPMHITIIAAGILQDKGIPIEGTMTLLLFMILKTVADVGMYVIQRRGFKDKPESD
jgi:hypothetical protein